MSEAFVWAWLRAFALTQAVEVPIYRQGYGASLRLAFAASAVTHPVVWFVFFGPPGMAFPMPYEARVLVAELFAWLVEAALLARVAKRPNALAWSLAANAASVCVGVLIRARWPAF